MISNCKSPLLYCNPAINIKLFCAATLLLLCFNSKGQETGTTDLLSSIEKESLVGGKPQWVIATFKTTRLINGHSVESVGKGVMDVKISHRFGTLNKGAYELFGLDNASMRMGLDFGITPNLMIGIGRSTLQKTYDAFLKIRILRQSSGLKSIPVTISYIPTIAVQTLRRSDPSKQYSFSSRMYYTHQLLVARKFSANSSLQLMPTFIHRNLVALNKDPNNILAIGIGGRQKLSKRISLNAEYYYQLPGYKQDSTSNALSIGFDIETGGHVFQLHFTNSMGMTERSFIAETSGKWEKGDILFGFNISRVFTIGKNR